MTDTFNSETRSAIMAAVRSEGNKSTERRMRAQLIAYGIRNWRIHLRQLPGTPDFAFPYKKLAVFVDGCFWHGCPLCYRRPKSSRSYWDSKVARNVARDKRDLVALRKLGWRVVRIWEHELKANPGLPKMLLGAFKTKRLLQHGSRSKRVGQP